ncbi:MAG: hypothetical protein WA192_10925 [Candidatus Acidiferrales bacterium]|jgi:hypothetical protein
MRHYSLEKWVDFVRDVIGEAERTEMQNHLQVGCAECSKELSMWQRFQQFAGRESVFAPPAGAARTVNAAFANRSAHRSGPANSEVVTLLFDSFRSPLLAGVRSSESASQQLLFGAGDYRIDVRIEPQMDSDKVVLIGQVLNSADPDERLSELPVNLLKGRKLLAESITTKFGEFQIECRLEGSLRLVVLLHGPLKVTLPLVEPVFKSGETTSDLAESNLVRRTSRIKKKGTSTKD